jgi:hypothetical protein
MFESLIRQKARRAGYRIARSGPPHGDYTLLTSGGYVVISPVSIEEIDKFLTEREQEKAAS